MENTIDSGSQNESMEDKKKALESLLVMTDDIPGNNESVNFEGISNAEVYLSLALNSKAFYERVNVVKVYLNLVRQIGSPPFDNPQIIEKITKIKQEFRNRAEVLELLKKYSDPRSLSNYEVVNHVIFFDVMQSFYPGIIARVYYPDRFKFLAEGLFEITDMSVDEIYSLVLEFLQKNIDFGKSLGYDESNRKSLDSLGTYMDIYQRMTSF